VQALGELQAQPERGGGESDEKVERNHAATVRPAVAQGVSQGNEMARVESGNA
jgi:hypothetical protein